MFLALPDFTGTNYSLFLEEFQDSFNFRSQFLKFGVMDNYSNGFQCILIKLMANATYIMPAEVFVKGKMVFILGKTFRKSVTNISF